MTQIVIDTDGSTPNVDAMEACIKFTYENYNNRKNHKYQTTREITTDRGFNVKVTEVEHTDKENSPCSVIFKLETII